MLTRFCFCALLALFSSIWLTGFTEGRDLGEAELAAVIGGEPNDAACEEDDDCVAIEILACNLRSPSMESNCIGEIWEEEISSENPYEECVGKMMYEGSTCSTYGTRPCLNRYDCKWVNMPPMSFCTNNDISLEREFTPMDCTDDYDPPPP